MPTAAPSSSSLCKHHAAASRRRTRVCVVSSLAFLLLLAAAAGFLAITALRPHPADTTISSIRLTSVSLSPGPGRISLNVTLDAVLSIRNPSRVASFAHSAAGHAVVYYRGAVAAEASVPPGRVAAGGSEWVTVSLAVLADRLLLAPRLYDDVVGGAGDLPLAVRTTLPGTVTVLGLLRRRVVVFTACDVTVSVRRPAEQSSSSSSCRYRTKF